MSGLEVLSIPSVTPWRIKFPAMSLSAPATTLKTYNLYFPCHHLFKTRGIPSGFDFSAVS